MADLKPADRRLNVGIVSPYSWDIPGGAQQHIRDLTEALTGLGHRVSVIAPCSDGIAQDYPYLTSAGRALPVRYNGSVARLCFGFASANRVKRWLEQGQFDVVHVHEPAVPSTSLIATLLADVPLVATFHVSIDRSRVYSAASPMLQGALEKISIRIAVSEAARESLIKHVGGNAVVIPNGVNVAQYERPQPLPGWRPRTLTGRGRTVGFLGRLDDARKGLSVLLDAFAVMAEQDAEVRLLVVGPGDVEDALKPVDPALRSRIHFTGLVSEAEKIGALQAMDVYCAPNLGGESFGIVLAEAMAASAPVVVSDIDAFLEVTNHGEAGVSFRNGDAEDLAAVTLALLADGDRRRQLSIAAHEAVQVYDWSHIAAEVASVYEAVTHPPVMQYNR